MDYCKEYEARFNQYYDELKWLYCELYKNQMRRWNSCADRCTVFIQRGRRLLRGWTGNGRRTRSGIKETGWSV